MNPDAYHDILQACCWSWRDPYPSKADQTWSVSHPIWCPYVSASKSSLLFSPDLINAFAEIENRLQYMHKGVR